MSKITINGVTIEIPDGASVSINNGDVIVNGKKSDFAKINSEVRVDVHGNVGDLKVDKGSVNCGNVNQSVNAGGSVNAENIGGNVSAGGSVNADDIGGNVSAGGSVVCDSVGGQVEKTKKWW